MAAAGDVMAAVPSTVPKCSFCKKTGHTAAQCSRPKLAFKDRRCHLCNKTGHLARACPDKDKDKPSPKANLVDDQSQKKHFLGIVEDSRPERHVRFTLGDAPILPHGGNQREWRRNLSSDKTEV